MPDETSTPWSGGYGERTFTPGTVAETRRLAAMAEACDPATIAVLVNLPIPPAGRCLEIGAGSGTVAQWIADNLSPRETVATDLDIQELEKIQRPPLRVMRHDVRTDSFPVGSFDLIVARNVLCNLPGREAALARMISWLAPRGWILVEDCSFFPAQSSPDPMLRALANAASNAMAATIGTDVHDWARSYPRPLFRHGLANIGWRVDCPTLSSTSPAGQSWKLSIQALASTMVLGGAYTPAQIADFQAHLNDPEFTDIGYAMVAAWGQRARMK